MNYALLLAGGKGTRIGSKLPKQFLCIGNKPIIIYTIQSFLSIKEIDKIVVVISQDWKKYLEKLLKKYNISNIEIVISGTTRQESVLNGCKHILKNLYNDNETIILSHDVVRPFVTTKIIKDNLKKIKYYDIVDTIISSDDTIVKIYEEKICDIPNRMNMFLCQTPQTFRLKEFLELSNTMSLNNEQLTDVSKIYLLNKKRIGYVLGSKQNFKITTKYDLEIANSIFDKINNKIM